LSAEIIPAGEMPHQSQDDDKVDDVAHFDPLALDFRQPSFRVNSPMGAGSVFI
jgi:hypothetical protein